MELVKPIPRLEGMHVANSSEVHGLVGEHGYLETIGVC
jgi:hypothetical protein